MANPMEIIHGPTTQEYSFQKREGSGSIYWEITKSSIRRSNGKIHSIAFAPSIDGPEVQSEIIVKGDADPEKLEYYEDLACGAVVDIISEIIKGD